MHKSAHHNGEYQMDIFHIISYWNWMLVHKSAYHNGEYQMDIFHIISY